MEDKKIIDLFFARSEQAIEHLDEKYGRLVTVLAEQIINDKEDAKECKNDTFLAVWNTIPPQRPNYLKAYVCKITRNLALKKVDLKSAKKRSNFYQVTLDELGESVSGGTIPQDLMEAKELVKYINQFLRNTDEQQRMLFIRRYFYGDSVESLAERFKMRPNTVSTRLSRLRKLLKAYLKEQEVVL